MTDDRAYLEETRRLAAERVKAACSNYGLYGNVILYEPSPFTRAGESNRNRLYIVAGLDPALGEDPPPKWLDPEHVLLQQERNCKLFYPGIWALDLSENPSDIDAMDQLVEYAKRAEFISFYYGMNGLHAPEKLRLSEVNQLISFYNNFLQAISYPEIQRKYQKDLNWFFKREKSKSAFRHHWLDYFRSDKFPDTKGPVAKVIGYFRRNRPEVSMEQLMETNGDIRKLQMQEFEYKYFRDFITNCYPEVSYVVGDREIVDHGLTPAAARDKVPVRQVSWEEYAAIRKDRFAEEGYEALADMKPSYWDFRDIYYRAVDEPIVAAVYNMITLQYAKCNDLGELSQFGDICMEDIPLNNFMNFVSLAKANGLRFYIDNRGDYAVPSFDIVHVVYNACQQEKMDGIIARLINDKVVYSHAMDLERPLQRQIDDVERRNGGGRKSLPHSRVSKHER